MYFKVNAEGEEVPISRETYDLANAIKTNDKNKTQAEEQLPKPEEVKPTEIVGKAKPVIKSTGVIQQVKPEGVIGISAEKVEPVKVNGTDVIEHGEDTNTAKGLENGQKPTNLTKEGIAEAKNLGEHLKENDKTSIIASPVERAQQTAEVAAKQAGITKGDISTNENLATWNIGEFDGKKEGSFDENYFIKNSDEKPKGGESFNDFKSRMEEAFNDTKKSPNDAQIIAHSKVMRALQALSKTDGKWDEKTTKEYIKLGEEEKAKGIKDKLALFKEKFAPKPKDLSNVGLKAAETRKTKALAARIVPEDGLEHVLSWLANNPDTIKPTSIDSMLGGQERANLNVRQDKSTEAAARDYVGTEKDSKTISKAADEIWDRMPEEIQTKFDSKDIRDELEKAILQYPTRIEAAKALLEKASDRVKLSPEEQQEGYWERKGQVEGEEATAEPIKIEGGFVPFKEGGEEALFAVKEVSPQEIKEMEGIVKDYVNNGVTSLAEIKKEIGKELGYNTKALRQTIEDAYNIYTTSPEYAFPEVKAGILGRFGNKMAEMFGKAAQKPYIVKDSKAIENKYNDISETGGRPAFQIKLPNGENVTAKPIDANVVNGFYSPLELQINQMKQDKMPAKQWLDKLRSEEAKWSGLADWLSQQKESLTKDQIKNFLNTNKVEIFEIVKGEPNKLDQYQLDRLKYLEELDAKNPGGAIDDMVEGEYKDSAYDELMYLQNVRDASSSEDLINLQKEFEQKARVAQQVGLKDKADKYWDESHRYTKRLEILELSPEGEGGILNPTKFSQYTIRGEKENYREILITQPRKNIITPKDDVFYEAKNKEKELKDIDEKLSKEYRNTLDKLLDLRMERDNIDNKKEKSLEEKIKLRGFTEKIVEISKIADVQDEEIFKNRLKINSNNQIIEKYQDKIENVKFKYTTHFDEDNILVHTRISTRQDVDGNKVLFAEEIQSDWGQQGREEGFKTETLTESERKRFYDLRQKLKDDGQTLDSLKNSYRYTFPKDIREDINYYSNESKNYLKASTSERKKLLTASYEERINFKFDLIEKINNGNDPENIKEDIKKFLRSQIDEEKNEFDRAMSQADRGIFDIDKYNEEQNEYHDLIDKEKKGWGKEVAPFVTKTNDWAKLALKSLLKEAVKAGADKLAWSNGDQQNDRWRLSKYVDSIEVFKVKDGAYHITGFKNGNERFDKEIENTKSLQDNIGKEFSDKIVKDFSDEKLKHKVYDGVDLELGGNGMRAFYGSPTENKIGLIGEVAKSLFKQTPEKLELKGASNIQELKENLKKEKDNLTLIKSDLKYGKEYSKQLSNNISDLNNSIWENEEEFNKLNSTQKRLIEESFKLRDYIGGGVLDEQLKELHRQQYKLETELGVVKSNREFNAIQEELNKVDSEVLKVKNKYLKIAEENGKKVVELKQKQDNLIEERKKLSEERSSLKEIKERIDDAPRLEKSTTSEIKRLEDKISKGNPVQYYVNITPELKEQVKQGLPLFMANPNGADVLGFSYNNRMYLNGEKLNPNTIIHEANHIWTEWIKDNDPKIYDKGIELVEKSPYLEKAKNSKFYQEQAEKLTTAEEKEAYFKHEALSMAVGDKGAQFVLESKKATFQEWLKTLWAKIKNLTGFKDLTEEQFQNLTFDEFTKMAVKEILGKENAVDKLNAMKSFRSKKNFIKDNLKYETNKKAIDELDFTEDDLIQIAKSNFDLSTFKNIKDAVQKRSTKEILQRKQRGDGEEGGRRRRVEPRVEGEAITGEGEGKAAQPKGITQIPESIENVGLSNQDIDYVGITEADINSLRKSLGLPKYEGLPTETHLMLMGVAQEMIKKGVDIQSLYDKIRRGDVLSNYENAFMAEYRAALDLELKNNPTKELLDKIKEFANTFQVGASLTGKALESLKIMKKLNEANTLSNFLLNRQEDKGFPLTAKMIVDETAKFEKVDKAKKDLKESVDKDIEEQFKSDAEKQLKTEPKVKKSHEEYVKERKAALAAAKEALKKLRSGEQGLMVTLPGVNELVAIAPHINEYVRSLVSEGISKLDDIATEVHKEFSELVDGLTKRDVLDVIAGKYNTKKRTESDITASVRLLKREAELLGKLEQARRGEEDVKSESQIREKSKRIKELEDKIKEVKELNRAKQMAEEGVSDESSFKDLTDAEYNKKRQKFLDEKIKKLEDDIKNKNYEKEPTEPSKYNISKKTQEKMDKVIELEKALALDRYNDQYAKLSKWEKAWDKVENISNIKRVVQTAIDASIWFRQLAKLTLNPRKWDIAKKFLVAGSQSVFSQKNYDRLMYSIHQAPDFKESLEDGVRYNELDAIDSKNQNEMYPKSFIFKIPIVRDLITASQRIADASLNIARYELYNKYKKNLLSQGITRESDPKVYEEMGKLVMNTTGSGNMLKILETAAGKKTAGSIFYGARLMAANFNTLNPMYYAKMPKEVRSMAMKDLAAYTSTILATTLALAAAGGSVSVDPDDPEFLQIRFGEKVYDFTAGQAAYIRTFLRLVEAGYARATKSKFEAKKAADFAVNSTLNFFRNKLAPNKSYGVNAIVGKNSIGQDFDPMEVFKIYPMYADDAYKAAKEDGFISLFTVLMPNILGVGYASYYSDKAMKPMDEMINLAQDSDEVNPQSIRKNDKEKKGISKDEFDKYIKLRDDLISENIKKLYEQGIWDKEEGEYKAVKESKSEDVSKAILKAKRKATVRAKTEFNIQLSEDEVND
jgi:broad specificity phosphatase PhoE